MSWDARNQLFFGILCLLFLVNLLSLNDVISLWNGAETHTWQYITAADSTLTDPFLATHQLMLSAADELPGTVWLRLSNGLLLLISLGVFYFVGLPIFGGKTTRLALLAILSSWLLISAAKVSSLDAWSAAWQMLSALLLIRFLKQPQLIWRITFYAFAFLALWSAPVGSTLLLVLMGTGYAIWHPERREMMRLNPWLAVLGSLGLLYGMDLLRVQPGYAYFPWDWRWYPQYLLYSVAAVLPMLGFLIAGMVDGVRKLRRGEERALILLIWLGAALLAQSLSLQLVFALLIAKHLQDFFLDKYPYGGLIKTISLLHLILLFFVALFAMIGGLIQFSGVGFRSGLAFAGSYWMLSLAGVIGLYAKNVRFVWAGTLLGGILVYGLFLLRILPLIEGERVVPQMQQRLSAERYELREELRLISEEVAGDPLPIYLQQRYGDGFRRQDIYNDSAAKGTILVQQLNDLPETVQQNPTLDTLQVLRIGEGQVQYGIWVQD